MKFKNFFRETEVFSPLFSKILGKQGLFKNATETDPNAPPVHLRAGTQKLADELQDGIIE